MPNFDYDLIVIGAGSGGTRAARISSGHGAKTAIAKILIKMFQLASPFLAHMHPGTSQ